MIRILVCVLLLAVATLAQAGERRIVLASTTSTDHSGLLAHLIPRFTGRTGIEVRVLAVGTGQAFDIARRGDADVLLVHDRIGEEAFVAAGFGQDRHDVMYNDYILLGPREDPAGVRESTDVAEAFRRIAARGSVFTSRGDDSGTHRTERRLWALAGVDPSPHRWYRELGSGMGPTLNTSVDLGAYTLSDRATWARFRNRRGLEILFQGDPPMFNPYSSLLVSPDRHPHLRHDLARSWHEWLVSAEGQAAIAAFRIDGEQLFFPNADGRVAR